MLRLRGWVLMPESDRIEALEEIRDRARAEGRARLAEAEQELARVREQYEAEVAALQERLAVQRQEADLLRAERDRARGHLTGILYAVPIESWN